MKYEVGKPFPHPNILPGQEHARAHIVGSSFDIYYYIDKPKKQDIRTFTNTLLRLYLYIEDHVPFISVAYFGTPWNYDLTLNVVSEKREVIERFFEEGNACTLFLIDANDNTMLGARMIGLPIDFIGAIKESCQSQLLVYTMRSEVDQVINRVYQKNNTLSLMGKSSKMIEFKGR